MNSNFWSKINQQQDSIILGSTNLRIRLELRVNGIAWESGVFDNPIDAMKWVGVKKASWKAARPTSKLVFVQV